MINSRKPCCISGVTVAKVGVKLSKADLAPISGHSFS
jgi:hypothetical protein